MLGESKRTTFVGGILHTLNLVNPKPGIRCNVEHGIFCHYESKSGAHTHIASSREARSYINTRCQFILVRQSLHNWGKHGRTSRDSVGRTNMQRLHARMDEHRLIYWNLAPSRPRTILSRLTCNRAKSQNSLYCR